MARTGRKQLAVQITLDSFDKFEQIKAETGLSNAKIIEMLIQNYKGSTSYNDSDVNINTNPKFVTEERVAEMIQEALANINTNTNTNINTEEEPLFTVKPFEAVYVPPYSNPLEDEYYVIKKTAKIGDPVIGSAEYELDGFNWYLSDGYRPHFDNTGKPIPFRMTSSTGELLDVTEDEVKEIEDKTGLTVKFER